MDAFALTRASPAPQRSQARQSLGWPCIAHVPANAATNISQVSMCVFGHSSELQEDLHHAAHQRLGLRQTVRGLEQRLDIDRKAVATHEVTGRSVVVPTRKPANQITSASD